MPPARVAILAGLLLALGGTLAVLYFARDRAQIAPSTVRFDAGAAAVRAAEKIAIEPLSPPSPPVPGGPPAYAEATVALDNADEVARFLFAVHGGTPEAAILIARVRIGARDLAPMPLLVATRAQPPAGSDKEKAKKPTEATGPAPGLPFAFAQGSEPRDLTQAFALTNGEQIMATLDVAYVKTADAAPAAIEAAALARSLGQGLPLLAGADGFAARAERFRARFVLGADERLERIAALNLDLAAPTRRVAFKDARGKVAGTITIGLALRGPMIANGSLDFRRAAALAVGPERRVGSYLARQGALVAAIVAEPASDAEAACARLVGALGADLGLAAIDAARIVATVARTRASFNAPVSSGACGPTAAHDNAAQGAQPAAAAEAESKVLRRLAGALRQPPPRKGGEPLTGLFAGTVALLDRSGVWLAPGEAGVFAGERARVQPAAEPGEAIDAVRALPVARMGCFGNGRGAAVGHRGALLELRGDNGLWHLNLAFDDAGKIAAVAFDAADQADFCRLAGRRNQQAGACMFAAGRYRGIDPKRC